MGTGLGLAISRGIVESMAGRIGAESEVWRGSTFTVEIALPVAEEVVAPRAGHGGALAGARLLIVDDSDINRRILVEQSRAWGMVVTAVPSAGIAWDMLQSGDSERPPFDLVLTDYRMRDMSGAELVRRIRADARLADLPLIVLSSLAEKTEVADLGDLAADAWLLKPIRVRQLGNVIGRVLQAARRELGTPPLRGSAAVLRSGPPSADPLIAIVDDTIVNQRVLEAMLKALGFRTLTAGSGPEALRLVCANGPDMLLTDITMPEMDGYDLARALRAREAGDGGARLPIVALTAHVSEENRMKCAEAGIDDVVVKPVRRADLERVIGRRLTERARGAA